jgi:hypothetical protein
MHVAGLLSNEQEAKEVQFILNVCKLEKRIHFIVRKEKLKELLKKEQ